MRLTGISGRTGAPARVVLATALAALLLAATPAVGATPASEEEPTGGSSPEQTDQALAVLEEVTESLAEPAAAPEKLHEPDEAAPDLSAQLAELVAVYDDLPGPEQRTADRILARPTDGNDPLGYVDYGDSDVFSKCGDLVCVHRVSSGTHKASRSWASTVLTEVERAWQVEVNQLGYRRPASDGTTGNRGVSGVYLDVYLGEVSAYGAYGYAATDRPGSGAAYLILDNDYSNMRGNPLNALRVTAAHEFFHAVQYAYRTDAGLWLMEATATWIEEQVHDAINDNRQYLRRNSPLTRPGLALDAADPWYYDSWIFFEHLSQRHGPHLVRDVWKRVGKGAPAMNAIKKALKARGTSLRKEFGRFAGSNTIPAKTYAEGRSYPRAKPARKPKLGKKRRTAGWQTLRVDHLAATTVRFRPDGKFGKKWRLKATVKGPGRLQAELVALRTNGKLIRKRAKVTPSGRNLGATFATKKVKWVAVTVANTSTKRKHDRTAVRIKGKLRKK